MGITWTMGKNSTSKRRRAGRPKGAESTREAILAAGEQLFGRLGFDATSTREISELSGVNKALIHYHFQSKDALLAAVLDRHYAKLTEVLLAAVAGAGAKSTEERLRKALDAYVDFLAEHRSFATIIQREVSAGSNVEEIWKRTLPLFQMVTRWLEETLPATRSGPLSAPQLLLSFYAMTVGSFVAPPVLEKLFGAEPLGARAIAARKAHLHRMMDLVLADLGAPRKAKP